MSVGGVDTYYDYDERRWKFRRLGGGPVHTARVCPGPSEALDTDRTDRTSPASLRGTSESRTARVRAGDD